MIWFYPLNELEITGYEVFALAGISPLLLGIKPLRKLLSNRWILALLRLIVCACIYSFQLPTTDQRLIVLAIGVAAQLLVTTISLFSHSTYQRLVFDFFIKRKYIFLSKF